VPLCLSQDADSDALLDRDPFALLVGMLLDQQFPMERAFAGPALLAQRLGRNELDPRELASYDPAALVEIFRGPPAVHRYPGSMAGRVQAAALPPEESDGVGLAYLADVFVVDDARGHGVGTALVQAMIDDGPGADFRWMLHTADAHGLYRRFGFAEPDTTYLERPGKHAPVSEA